MSQPKVRDWFYYRARSATADRFTRLAKPGQIVTVIGDAAQARQEQGGDRQRLRGGAVAGKVREWFYHRGAQSPGDDPESQTARSSAVHRRCRQGRQSREAIASAFEAAMRSR